MTNKNNQPPKPNGKGNGGKGRGALQALTVTTVIGTELGVTATLGFLIGRYLDNRLGTTPAFLIICLLMGMGMGIFGIVKTIETFFKDDKGVK